MERATRYITRDSFKIASAMIDAAESLEDVLGVESWYRVQGLSSVSRNFNASNCALA